MAIDQPPYRHHAQHHADDQHDGGAGQIEVGPDAVQMEENRHERREMDSVVREGIVARTER